MPSVLTAVTHSVLRGESEIPCNTVRNNCIFYTADFVYNFIFTHFVHCFGNLNAMPILILTSSKTI